VEVITAVARSPGAAFLQFVEKWLVDLPMKTDEVAQARSSKNQVRI
jgi:hypothetical protein